MGNAIAELLLAIACSSSSCKMIDMNVASYISGCRDMTWRAALPESDNIYVIVAGAIRNGVFCDISLFNSASVTGDYICR